MSITKRTVTKQDLMAALGRMRMLPTRATDDPSALFEAYVTAMDRVLVEHLSEAVTAIMQGALGHGFFPSPPELRIQSDRIRQAELERERRIAQARRQCEEAVQYQRQMPEPSPEAKARVQAMVDEFIGRSSHAND